MYWFECTVPLLWLNNRRGDSYSHVPDVPFRLLITARWSTDVIFMYSDQSLCDSSFQPVVSRHITYFVRDFLFVLCFTFVFLWCLYYKCTREHIIQYLGDVISVLAAFLRLLDLLRPLSISITILVTFLCLQNIIIYCPVRVEAAFCYCQVAFESLVLFQTKK